MIDKLNLFRVKVFQPEKLIAGDINKNSWAIMDLVKNSNDIDLIIIPFGAISGFYKNQSLSNLKPLKYKVTETLSTLNSIAQIPIIVNDITGLYYLDNRNLNPVKIENNKIKIQLEDFTISFIDDIDKIFESAQIHDSLMEDLVVFYDPSGITFPFTTTKIYKNSALALFNSNKVNEEITYFRPYFYTRGSWICSGSSTTTFDIEPRSYDSDEKPTDDSLYLKTKIRKYWTIENKEDLNFFNPAISYIVNYDPEYCRMTFEQQIKGTVEKLKSLGNNSKCFIGVSGGSDSTLSLLVTYCAYKQLGWDVSNIFGVSMPCFGTTDRTKNNAAKLIEGLGVTYREINIENSVTTFLNDLGHPLDNTNTTYENAQARMRMMMLFGLSNDLGGIVIGTGDLSEHWLGWCTFGGDDLAGYNPNCRVLKTTVLQIIRYLCTIEAIKIWDFANIVDTLTSIVSTPISPELVKGGSDTQKSEDILGPYILHDIFITGLCLGWGEGKIKDFARIYTDYSEETIAITYSTNLKRFSQNQFKRSINIPGPKVGYLDSDILDNINMPIDFKL